MSRVGYLDQAKAWGMVLVYYGHFLEVLLRAGSLVAFPQWKIIYTFHMPFFFFLTGAFWIPGQSISKVFADKVKARLVPVLFFGLLLVPAWLSVKSPLEVLASLGRYVSGKTDLNAITWFLVCLFVVEVLAAILGGTLRLDLGNTVIYAALFYSLGLLLVSRAPAVAHYTGIVEGFWYFNEAVVALSFYLMGYALRKVVLSPERLSRIMLNSILVVSGAVLFLTFDLNQGPFPNEILRGVVMAISSHGDPIFFGLTAFAGIFFILTMAWFSRRAFKWTEFVGRNSLIFLGLNGINLHFLDRWFLGATGFVPDTALQVAALTGGYTLSVLLVFSLLVLALRRWTPELVGYPWVETSLLSPMGSWLNRGPGSYFARLARKYILK